MKKCEYCGKSFSKVSGKKAEAASRAFGVPIWKANCKCFSFANVEKRRKKMVKVRGYVK